MDGLLKMLFVAKSTIFFIITCHILHDGFWTSKEVKKVHMKMYLEGFP
jgi:hypothetical protein